MKNFESLKKFKLSREQLKKTSGGSEGAYCRSVAYGGQLRTFCDDSSDLVDSWAAVWIGFGGQEMIIRKI